MKKIFLLIIALFLSIFIVNPSYAQQTSKYGYPTGNQNSSNTYGNWYLGVGVGYAHIIGLKSDFDSFVSQINSKLSPGESVSESVNNSSFASNVYIGYKFDKYIAVQAGFDYLGSYKYSENLNYLGYYFNANDTAYVYNFPVELKGILPVNNVFSIYGLIGGNYWLVNESGSASSNEPGINTNIPNNNASGFSPAYGIGISYNLPEHNKIKLEYDYYQNLFNSSTTISKSHYDVEYLSLQWQYDF
jgi:OOP family OmpA-OmpF porin